MKILLKQDMAGFGRKGEVVDMRTGYARNFIIPKGVGIQASKKDEERAQQLKEERDRTNKERQEKLEEALKRVNGKTVSISAHGGENGQLYAGLNKGHILPAINEQLGEMFEEDHIVLPEHIKSAGEHEISLVVGGKKAKVIVNVEATK